MKRFVALARVSSREQEREGFSLEVQEEGLRRYAEQAGGAIVQLYRIAETASKAQERKTFREMIAYAKRECTALDGLLFYKVDRASRNLFDYVELERLESEYDVPFISVSQQTDNNPAGRMMRRTLANMASYYTEQQSVDVREGLARRVQEGWFVTRGPYGYRNVRIGGRSVVEIARSQANNVRRLYHLYAYENQTLDGLVERMDAEGRVYRNSCRKFTRSVVHAILRDRAYIGEIEFRGQWHPGKHEPIVDRTTWDRVQALLGDHIYKSHEMTYAGELIRCGHCGRPISGECKTKRTKNGERSYVYYRCARYNVPGHPRTRVPEAEFDRQLLALFEKMRIDDDGVRDWFRAVLRSQTIDAQAESRAQRAELQQQLTMLVNQQDRLVNLLIAEDIDQETYARKGMELRDKIASLKLQLEVVDRSRDEFGDLASKVFELSQTLQEKWLTANYAEKRRILEIVCLNFELDGVTLVPTIRKPFDAIAEGLISRNSRAERI